MNDNELQVLHSQAQLIAEQLDRIDSSLMEIEYLKNSLDEFNQIKKGTEIFTPMSNGIFIKSKLEDSSSLLINVGNGVVVEKSVVDAKKLFDSRIDELNKAKEEMLIQMQKIENKLMSMEGK